MIEALWSVQFGSNLNDFGAGCVVLETGRVLGGDSGYYYVGSYKVENDVIAARIKVTHYSGELNSIFGNVREFELQVTGKPERNIFVLNGHVEGHPELKISIRLTRRAELP